MEGVEILSSRLNDTLITAFADATQEPGGLYGAGSIAVDFSDQVVALLDEETGAAAVADLLNRVSAGDFATSTESLDAGVAVGTLGGQPTAPFDGLGQALTTSEYGSSAAAAQARADAAQLALALFTELDDGLDFVQLAEGLADVRAAVLALSPGMIATTIGSARAALDRVA